MAIPHCLLISSCQERQFHHATDMQWSRIKVIIWLLTSSGQAMSILYLQLTSRGQELQVMAHGC